MMVPAVATNAPLPAPAAIVRLDGTVNRPELLDRLTVAAVTAPLFRESAQVVVWPEPRLAGPQVNPDNSAGATRVREKVRDIPFAVAVMVAV